MGPGHIKHIYMFFKTFLFFIVNLMTRPLGCLVKKVSRGLVSVKHGLEPSMKRWKPRDMDNSEAFFFAPDMNRVAQMLVDHYAQYGSEFVCSWDRYLLIARTQMPFTSI